MPNPDELMRHLIEMKADIAVIKANIEGLPERMRTVEDRHIHLQGQLSVIKMIGGLATIAGTCVGWVANHLWGVFR